MINVKKFETPETNIQNVLKYSRAGEPVPEVLLLAETCIAETSGKFSCRVCWDEFPVKTEGDSVDFGFAKTFSENLPTSLEGCETAIVFAASVGFEIDRLITKFSFLSPSKSLMFQAIGTEKVESLCDQFCNEINEQMKLIGKKLRTRFSPGYGDFQLGFQREIFKVLDCTKLIGITLNESLLMSPSKSVTAIVGVTRR